MKELPVKEVSVKVGDTVKTKTSGIATCVGIIRNKGGNLRVKAQFDDGTITDCYVQTFKHGSVKNRNLVSVSGVGFIGVGEFSSRTFNGKLYHHWKNLLSRGVTQEETINPDWYNFQNFCRDLSGMENFDNIESHVLRPINGDKNPKWSKDNCYLRLNTSKLGRHSNKCGGKRKLINSVEPIGNNGLKLRNGLVLNHPETSCNVPKKSVEVIAKQQIDSTPCETVTTVDLINNHLIKAKKIGFKASWLVITGKALSDTNLSDMKANGRLKGGSTFPVTVEFAPDFSELIVSELETNGFKLETSQIKIDGQDVYTVKVGLV